MNIIKRILIIFIAALAVYLLICQFIVYPVDELVESTFYNTEQNIKIKEDFYDRQYKDEQYILGIDIHRVFALWLINTSYVWYKYNYFVYQNGEPQEGEADISYKVKVKYKNRHWTIADTF